MVSRSFVLREVSGSEGVLYTNSRAAQAKLIPSSRSGAICASTALWGTAGHGLLHALIWRASRILFKFKLQYSPRSFSPIVRLRGPISSYHRSTLIHRSCGSLIDDQKHLCTIRDLELAQNVRNMIANGFGSEHQCLRNYKRWCSPQKKT
jgi:hypothetical protein